MAYYDSIAEGYDELHGEEQAGKLEVVLKHIKIDPNSTVLDVGCGTGLSGKYITGRTYGADPAERLIRKAKDRLFQVVRCSGEHLPFRPYTFDYVFSMTAIHNYTDFELGLIELSRVVKKTAVISVLRNSKKIEEITKSIRSLFESWKITVLGDDKTDLIFILERQI